MSFEQGDAPGRQERGRGHPRGDAPWSPSGEDHPHDATGQWYPHPGSGRVGEEPNWGTGDTGQWFFGAGAQVGDESPLSPGGTRRWSGAGQAYHGAGGPGGTGPNWTAAGGWPPPQYPAGFPRQPRRPRRRVGLALLVVALSVLVGLGVGRYALQNAAGLAPSIAAQDNPPSSQGSPGATATNSLNVAGIAAKVDPSIVNVNTVLGFQNRQAAGTGIVLTSEGEVLTNNHVVEGATSIQVSDVGNGRTYKATVVGYDRSHDVAVLRLQGASGLRTASIGDSSKVAVGDAVLGLGNAGGGGGTPVPAAGTVTALGQSITAADDLNGSSEQLNGLIQVNANIQSGDSGGPLVNASGQVIGVDTAASTGYQFRGRGGRGAARGGQAADAQGFAIPINQAMSIVKQIESGSGTSTVHIGETALLGVSVSSAGGQGLPEGESPGTGAVVQQVISGSPAEQAGLERGDVILSLDGQSVDSATALTNLMDTHHPGDRITITWTDQTGRQHTGTVVPVSGPVG
ncbi:S1C family serine protease [Gandjariella thermophila]|uniref:Serine protease n=1 Tax=Gandjariella thermophila TaxID=1931992 RepID=A0A4D4J300_9PSEU|nr:trypsin-like peptidase domain-containing protein [Gandjariella thermophila]GDY28387.1 serine protease [Gandjariella thermophila]